MPPTTYLITMIVSCIPKGYVSTYGRIASYAGISNPRVVGYILHHNHSPETVPCHRVVNKEGRLAPGFAFGGPGEQKTLLEREGVKPLDETHVDLEKHLWQPTPLLEEFFLLMQQFGDPGPWPWYEQPGSYQNYTHPLRPHSPDEIVIGSILTQNTHWNNVIKALSNLEAHGVTTLEKLYHLCHEDLALLKELIRPSGYYNQKSQRLKELSTFVVETYGSLDHFFAQPLASAREKLLSLRGIGNETADTILLFAGNKPTFIIDTYTKRFLNEKHLSKSQSYEELQKYCIQNLPGNARIYQSLHALIIHYYRSKRYGVPSSG